MREQIKNYANTSVHWGKTQSDIMKLFAKRDITDVQFTNISAETAKRSGLIMDDNCVAIMVLFQKQEQLSNGVAGNIPVRIIIPNVPNGDKTFNQYYRLLYWYLKSKFEAIDTGLVEFAEEFMPHLQISDNKGKIGRVWDNFKNSYYKSIGSGKQANAGLLPPVNDNGEED